MPVVGARVGTVCLLSRSAGRERSSTWAGRRPQAARPLLLLQTLEIREGLLQRIDAAAVLGEVAGLQRPLGGLELGVRARDEVAGFNAQAAARLPAARSGGCLLYTSPSPRDRS